LSPWPSKVVCFLTLPPFRERLQALASFSSAPSSPWTSKIMCFLTLPLFECAFEPSSLFECAFEPSPLFKYVSSPHCAFDPSSSFQVLLWALISGIRHQRDPFFVFVKKKESSFFFLHRAGHLQQLDHSRNLLRFFFLSGRSFGTIKPLVKPFSCFILPIR